MQWPTSDESDCSSDEGAKESQSDQGNEVKQRNNLTKEKLSTEDVLKLTALEMAKFESCVLHKHLAIVDPAYANRMHPNNKRKIIR